MDQFFWRALSDEAVSGPFDTPDQALLDATQERGDAFGVEVVDQDGAIVCKAVLPPN